MRRRNELESLRAVAVSSEADKLQRTVTQGPPFTKNDNLHKENYNLLGDDPPQYPVVFRINGKPLRVSSCCLVDALAFFGDDIGPALVPGLLPGPLACLCRRCHIREIGLQGCC